MMTTENCRRKVKLSTGWWQVKDGRLGLHEKSMPVCGAGYAGVCEWRPTNWTAAKNAGLSTTAGHCLPSTVNPLHYRCFQP